MAIHELAARFYRDQLAASWVPGYLARRGFGPEVLRRWQVGYAPAGRDKLIRHLRTAGYADPLITAAGLARRSRRGVLADTFRDRAVLPVRSPHGTIVAFIGRAADYADSTVPKYLNSPATVLYDKGRVLFGLWEARDTLAGGAVPVIAEGPFDVMAIAVADPGRFAPVSPCGAALTVRQTAILGQACDLADKEIIVAFDADNAGRRGAVRAYHLLRPVARDVRAASLPSHHDPAQLLTELGPAALADALRICTRPLADLVVDAEVGRWTRWLRFAEGRVGALRAIAPVIAAMPPSDVGRQVSRLADQLGLDHATVTDAVTDAVAGLV